MMVVSVIYRTVPAVLLFLNPLNLLHPCEMLLEKLLFLQLHLVPGGVIRVCFVIARAGHRCGRFSVSS